MCLLLAFGLMVVGCDSGGSNGSSEPELNGNIKVRLESSGSSDANAKVSGVLTAQFFRTRNGGSCDNTDGKSVNEIPADVTLSPDTGVCDNPRDYDRVTVSFNSSGSSGGLTMTVLDGNGNEIGTDTSPSDGLSVDSGALPDSGNDDDGGGGASVPSSLTGKWKVTSITPPSNVDLSSTDIFWDITSSQIEITLKGTVNGISFCQTQDPDSIVNVDGNTITIEDEEGEDEGTFGITNGGDKLTVDGINGETVEATRVSSIPECP
jgi:hypothetical protein